MSTDVVRALVCWKYCVTLRDTMTRRHDIVAGEIAEKWWVPRFRLLPSFPPVPPSYFTFHLSPTDS